MNILRNQSILIEKTLNLNDNINDFMPIIHCSNLNQLTKITQVPTTTNNNIININNNNNNNLENLNNYAGKKIYFNLSGPIQFNDFYDKPRDSDTQTLINRSLNLFPKLMENTKIVDYNIEFKYLNSYNNTFLSNDSYHASNTSSFASSSIALPNNGLDSSLASSSSSSSLYNTGYVSVSYLNLNYSNTYHYNNPKKTKIINCLNYGLNEIYSISGILTQVELLLYNSNRESRL
ncbi:hypothetical protein B5S32_g3397 [[Candida] boidinii]|nr:hypothetical protein B5S32_g3397 [[Candida] boidinii]